MNLNPHPEATSYAEWGADFFHEAISEERVLGAVETIMGRPLDIGPVGVGPGRIAKVRAFGRIGKPTAASLPGERIAYRVVLPVDVTFELDLQVDVQRFEADVLVPITLTALALSGVRIHIHVQPPRPDEVQVRVRAPNRRATLVQRLGNVEGELQRFVADYVRRELEEPHVRAARDIDVSSVIDLAWDHLGPSSERGGENAAHGEAHP